MNASHKRNRKEAVLFANIDLEVRLVLIISKNAASFLFLEFLFTYKLITLQRVQFSSVKSFI